MTAGLMGSEAGSTPDPAALPHEGAADAARGLQIALVDDDRRHRLDAGALEELLARAHVAIHRTPIWLPRSMEAQ